MGASTTQNLMLSEDRAKEELQTSILMMNNVQDPGNHFHLCAQKLKQMLYPNVGQVCPSGGIIGGFECRDSWASNKTSYLAKLFL